VKRIASFLCCLLLLPLAAQAALPDCPAIRITAPETLAGAIAGSAYSASLTQTGASSATFAVSAGSLPSGLALAADGTLAGTPAQTGSFIFTAMATDTTSGCSGGRVYALSVIQINHAPSFTPGGSQTVLEDAGAQTVNGWATAISAGAGDTGQALSFIVTGNTNAALFSAAPAIDAASGNLSYTPAANANGTASITVVLRDDGGTANGGNDTSAPQTFVINVTAVNDAPSFTAGSAASAVENAGAQIFANFHTAISAGPANESAQTLSFATTVTGTTGSLSFSTAPAVAPNGTLTFTAANGTSGTATVSSVLSDNGGTANGGADASAPQTFTISVSNINDPPVFSVGGPQTVLEDAGAQTVAGYVTGIADGDDGSQAVTFSITSNTNAALFSAGPAIAANGTLTYTPAANANGSASVSVRAQDNGGTANGGNDTSAPQTFVINVTAVNDAPSFTPGADVTVDEDAGPASIAWATAVSAGPANESGQALAFGATVSSGAALFATAPAISATGQLTFTPAANANGTAIVSVTLQDDGGAANGGTNATAAQPLVITVNPVDDAPVAVNDSATVAQDSSGNAIDVLANDTDIDGGPRLITAVTQPANGVVAITGGGTGLTYTPDAGYSNSPPDEPADTFAYTLNGGSQANVAVSVEADDGVVDLGAYHINGSCGVLGVLGPGFTLTAGPAAPLPVGTSVLITGSGVANIGVFSVTGGTASVTVLSSTSRLITLTSALPAGATIAFRTTLSITVAFTLNAATTLPTGYVGTGSKPAGSVNATLVLCSAT
jgi:large repetitive protein